MLAFVSDHVGPKIAQTMRHETPGYFAMCGFPKIRCAILGIPIIKDCSILGSLLGSIVLGNYHVLSDTDLQFSGWARGIQVLANWAWSQPTLSRQGGEFALMSTWLAVLDLSHYNGGAIVVPMYTHYGNLT